MLYHAERILAAIAKSLVYLYQEGAGRAEMGEERGKGESEEEKKSGEKWECSSNIPRMQHMWLEYGGICRNVRPLTCIVFHCLIIFFLGAMPENKRNQAQCVRRNAERRRQTDRQTRTELYRWLYVCRGVYNNVSEDTHWTPFINASVNYIRRRYPQPWDLVRNTLSLSLPL